MGFDDAILRCLSKYAVLSGRASPAEFWWFVVVYVATLLLTLALIALSVPVAAPALGLLALLTPPVVAVTVRRLHDIGAPGATLIFMIPVLGQLLLVAWLIRPGVPRRNRFGAEPEKERERYLLVAR